MWGLSSSWLDLHRTGVELEEEVCRGFLILKHIASRVDHDKQILFVIPGPGFGEGSVL